MKALIPGVALLFAVAISGGARAQAINVPPHTEAVAVSYADIDLNRPAGSSLLNSRLRSAALRLCGDANLVTTRHRERQACIQTTMENGWDQVAANRSTRLAENRTIVLAAVRPSSPR